jgi:hypothetical protein
LRQEDFEFKNSLGYIARHCLKRKKKKRVGLQWLTPIIPATWEAEIRRIEFPAQELVLKTPSPK